MEIEKELKDRDLIVSSTDARGIINYVNSTFIRISEFTKHELYGQPHNIVRHPDMPKAIFKYLWEKLLNKKPVVAYVKNYVKGNEKFYWVKAVLYPKIENNHIKNITSYRTKATKFEIAQISEIYKELVEYEKNHSVNDSLIYFKEYLQKRSLSYDQLISRLNDQQQVLNVALLNFNISEFRSDHLIFRSRIQSLVEKGYENIEVVSPTCCDFGKRLQALEDEPFAKDKKFLEIKRLHEKVHEELQRYVDANQESKEGHMKDVYHDIEILFKLMRDLKMTIKMILKYRIKG